MNCHEIQFQIYAFLDGELDEQAAMVVQQHMATCASCQAHCQSIEGVEASLRRAFQDEPVPTTLWPRIRASLTHAVLPPSRVSWRWRGRLWWGLAPAMLVLLLTLSVGLLRPDGLFPGVRQARLLSVPVEDLQTFVVSRRALDIASTDPQALRQWFQDKINFPPPRVPMQAGMATLVGGRLCHFLERRVAAFMYTTDDHYLALFVMPRQGANIPPGEPLVLAGQPVQAHAVQGYTHLLWSQTDLLYSLVSDLPQAQLLEMAQQVVQAG